MTRMDIERLLQWAYREELCKGGEAGQSSVLGRYAMLGTRIDDDHPQFKLPPVFGDPHPDALRLGQLVRQIGDVVIDWGRSARAFMGDAAVLITDDPLIRGGRVLRVSYDGHERRARPIRDNSEVLSGLQTQALLVMHANGGTRPDWRTEPICLYGIRVQGGYRVLGGRATRRGQYTYGTYCPLYAYPDPRHVAHTRAEYWAWWRGLVELARLAEGELREHAAVGPAAPEMPWRN